MDILSSLGQMYMFILLVLLFIGSGLAGWAFINNFTSNNSSSKVNVQNKGGQAVQSKPVSSNNVNNKVEAGIKLGGFKMANSRWVKLAVFSFVGILISVALMGFASTNSASGHNHADNQTAANSMQMGNTNMNNMQGGMNGNMSINNMPVNGYMPSNSMQMGNVPMNNGMQNDSMLMQQQLYMMQQQMSRLQQQLMNMQAQQGSMNMQQSSGGMGGM